MPGLSVESGTELTSAGRKTLTPGCGFSMTGCYSNRRQVKALSWMMRWLAMERSKRHEYYRMQALSVLGLAVSNPTSSIGSYFSESSLVFSKLNITQHQGTIRCQNQQGNSSWTLSVTVLLSPCKMANEAISPCPPKFFNSNFQQLKNSWFGWKWAESRDFICFIFESIENRAIKSF